MMRNSILKSERYLCGAVEELRFLAINPCSHGLSKEDATTLVDICKDINTLRRTLCVMRRQIEESQSDRWKNTCYNEEKKETEYKPEEG